MAINNPFYKGSVIEISSIDETIDFLVTDNQYICLEDILEFTDKVQSIRFLTQEEVSKKGFSFKLDGEDDPIPFNSLLEWIEKRASEESSGTFLLATKDL